MASFKQTIKSCMLRYPTIFPNPVDVCIHLFCVIGNGYEWIDGELVDVCSPDDAPITKMKYPTDPPNAYHEIEGLARFNLTSKLKKEAEYMQMKFVEDHIDEIIEACPTTSYFGNGQRGSHYFLRNVSFEYAHAFAFPEDIKTDWAKRCMSFINTG